MATGAWAFVFRRIQFGPGEREKKVALRARKGKISSRIYFFSLSHPIVMTELRKSQPDKHVSLGHNIIKN